ncbi:MAG: helix-turn-helix transcriptional regulator, partial [Gammaproteobacteria bacterium]
LYTNIAYQVRALRKQKERNWDQKTLAEKAGMLQPRISAIENPSNSKLNLDTLLRIANAFDVALVVKFAPFNELINWAESFSPDSFSVASFDVKTFTSAAVTDYQQVPVRIAWGKPVQQLSIKNVDSIKNIPASYSGYGLNTGGNQIIMGALNG